MTIGKYFRQSIIIVLIVLIGITTYYVYEVYSARQYTINTVLPAVRSTKYPLELSDLSSKQKDILLKVEDPRFFEHNGVDLSTPGAGITTITQGLVKVMYFKKFRPGIAKIRQTLIAIFALDPIISKPDQLHLFINIVYLGLNARGFEQAADIYFHKSFKQLDENEYMALVAMVIAPDTFNVQRFPERNRERVSRIKRLMSGEYKPKGLFDLYYGKLDKETQKKLPSFSYFESYYE